MDLDSGTLPDNQLGLPEPPAGARAAADEIQEAETSQTLREPDHDSIPLIHDSQEVACTPALLRGASTDNLEDGDSMERKDTLPWSPPPVEVPGAGSSFHADCRLV